METTAARILGLDYGSRTVGVALSDPLGLTAQALEIIRRPQETKLRKTLARIEELVREHGVKKIVLGMPLHMNGEQGERAEKTLAFKEMLERRTSLPVELEDERLTTVEATRVMNEMNLRGRERSDVVDSLAAAFILQTYLDREGSTLPGNPHGVERES